MGFVRLGRPDSDWTLFYDRTCLVCREVARLITGLDGGRNVRVEPVQGDRARRLALDPGEVHLVGPERLSGRAAISRLVQLVPRLGVLDKQMRRLGFSATKGFGLLKTVRYRCCGRRRSRI
jgi:predicted DCC family thiol-disulfide oxidoreductase YuxK